MVLTANLIETIPFPAPDVSLPGIQYISLADNRISTWSAVDSLSRWFPSLKTLTISGNPLLKGESLSSNSHDPFPNLRYLEIINSGKMRDLLSQPEFHPW